VRNIRLGENEMSLNGERNTFARCVCRSSLLLTHRLILCSSNLKSEMASSLSSRRLTSNHVSIRNICLIFAIAASNFVIREIFSVYTLYLKFRKNCRIVRSLFKGAFLSFIFVDGSRLSSIYSFVFS
jgi:hypothetical protein